MIVKCPSNRKDFIMTSGMLERIKDVLESTKVTEVFDPTDFFPLIDCLFQNALALLHASQNSEFQLNEKEYKWIFESKH